MRGIIVFSLIGLGIAGLIFQSLQSQLLNAQDAVTQLRMGRPWHRIQLVPNMTSPNVDEFGKFDAPKFPNVVEAHSRYV